MALEITKEKLLNMLDKLKRITELPDLYLADYFDTLRYRVDKECATKQLGLKKDHAKKKELEELWQKMVAKIDSFEKNCIRKVYNLNEKKIRINEIEKKLNNEKLIDLKTARYEIEKEENYLLQKLFQNKSIFFLKHSNDDNDDFIDDYYDNDEENFGHNFNVGYDDEDDEKSEKKIIDGHLIVFENEFISQKSIDES